MTKRCLSVCIQQSGVPKKLENVMVFAVFLRFRCCWGSLEISTLHGTSVRVALPILFVSVVRTVHTLL